MSNRLEKVITYLDIFNGDGIQKSIEYFKIYDNKISIIEDSQICRPFMQIQSITLERDYPHLTPESLLFGKIGYSIRRKCFYYILNRDIIRFPLTLESQDQIVFKYIAINDGIGIEKFINFLKENNIPLIEKYAFYLLGTLKYLDLNEINDWKISKYGSYSFGEAYYWKEYLLDEECYKTRITNTLKFGESSRPSHLQNDLDTFNVDIYSPIETDIIHFMYIKWGWAEVQRHTKNDQNKEPSPYSSFYDFDPDEHDKYGYGIISYIDPLDALRCKDCGQFACECSDKK